MIDEPFYNTEERYGYYSPTRVIAHSGSRHRTIPVLAGSKDHILVIDAAFAPPAFDDLFGDKEKYQGPSRTIVVRSEPALSDIEEAAAAINPETDLIVALGGGSTIDFAKALALSIRGYPIPPDENSLIRIPMLMAIPTTCGTGSETSRHCVLYDGNNRKFAVRHWGISPSLALLDPYFLKTSPRNVIVGSAFDSFMHHLEVFTLSSESPAFSRYMSAYWMRVVLNECLEGVASEFSEKNILQLQIASSFGGIALSNHRTGLIHTCAESLASIIHISHPKSLFVFFETIVKSYRTWFDEELKRLGFEDVTSSLLIDSWNRMLPQVGFADHGEDLKSVDPSILVNAIARDRVIFKEYPVELTERTIANICGESIARFL